MVVLDQFYQITEARTSQVSVVWKAAHIIACIVSAIAGFKTAFAFGVVLESFEYNCILNAQIVFDNRHFLNVTVGKATYHVPTLDLTLTDWGSTSECNFCQFTPLFIAISALVLGTFFILLSKGGAGYPTDVAPRPWHIVYPGIIYTLITAIVYLASTIKFNNGIEKFCNAFSDEFNTTNCYPAINIYVNQFEHENHHHVFDSYTGIQLAIAWSIIGVCTWVAHLLILLLRLCCGVDFQLQHVVVVPKGEELVENVIELQDLEDSDDISQV